MAEPTHIRVRNARVHNLKGVDLDVPRHQLVVFTGVSGSGKSSLAYDTIFKEGQRRFVESLSAYARQFLGELERPPVDAVEGVSPTLSIDQKTVNRNPRSTVGTVTEIADHLRLLMARLGTPHCPECGRTVSRSSVTQIVDKLVVEAAGERVQVLGPVVRERKGEYRKELDQLHRDGWVRARIDGQPATFEAPPTLARYEKHTIEVVVDRLKVDPGDRTRLYEAIETAARLGKGTAVVGWVDRERELVFSTERACPDHPEVGIPELEPRLFSFNAPQGACPQCNGLGAVESFDLDRLLDPSLPVPGAFRALTEDGKLPFAQFDAAMLVDIAKRLGAKVSAPVRDWPEDVRHGLIHGDPTVAWTTTIDRGERTEARERIWRGLLPMVESIWQYTAWNNLGPFRVSRPCVGCGGERLNPVARKVTFRDKRLPELARMSVTDAHALFSGIRLVGAEKEIGEQLLVEIRGRLEFLNEVGLGYLTIDRSAATLSGGESQRIRLAAQVGSALNGVTYVLDEPSIGLHARDNRRLLGALRRLRDRGNSVLVVEHDAETILAADFVVDVGPGAGRNGGVVVAADPPKKLLTSKASPTARWLRGEERIEIPERRTPHGAIGVRGARANNLRGVDVEFPLGCLVVVTGVSGSGKSSLVFEVLEPSVREKRAVGCDRVTGLAKVDKLVEISQSPIGRTPRSNPATYTGVFDAIRDLFAATPEARARGYKKGRFSFNVAGGRCEVCEGAGVRLVEMQFLPPVEVTCESCGGKRFNADTLEVTWKGLTIRDVLESTIEAALETFGAVPKIARVLRTLCDVGLGYVSLGQASTTLSGGEAQRVKLATELHRPATGSTLYLLDEPTTGLHFQDVRTLIAALQRLVDAGNSVIVVEHHLDLVKVADRLIDLGPEGGAAGGAIVGVGTPEELARLDTPTGKVLAELGELTGQAAAEPAAVYEPRRPRRPKMPDQLTVRGARIHNLRSIDVDVPLGKMTVITGVSGSGKTSLAFDTIFAEGQRQYVESLSTYARRFLGRVERAPVDRLEGLQPAIAIDQRASGHNPRSTVGTVTEINDVLRLLFARIGQVHCPQCGVEVRALPPAQAAVALREAKPGAGWLVARLRPAVDAAVRRDGLIHDGWSRLWVGDPAGRGGSGHEVELTEPDAIAALRDGCELVIDRIVPERTPLARVVEAVEAAYRIGFGAARFVPRSGAAIPLSVRAECPDHGVVFEGELTPRHFSFNARLGACPRCDGVGITATVVPERLFPNPQLGLWEAIEPRVGSVVARSSRNRGLIEAVLERFGSSPADPVTSWSDEARGALLEGLEAPVSVRWTQNWGSTSRTVEEARVWPGLLAVLEGWQARLTWLVAERPCPKCRGGRLRPELLAVRIGGASIADLTAMPVDRAQAAGEAWRPTGAAATIAERPLQELRGRLGFLVDVGLGYLPLDRAAQTLSGGEAQRIRLASQLGAGLCAVTYVLDEPTVGLHPRDTDRLIGTLEGLRDLGNTVLLVEHDPETIGRADHVIDLGPGAGIHGGAVLATGTPAELIANPASITGRWLAGIDHLPARPVVRTPRAWIMVRDPRGNNLRCGDVAFPTGVWTAVTGVSGSGKSTLVMDTLAPALQAATGAEVFAAPHGGVELGEKVDRVVVVDQSPIGRTPRSTPATYTKVLDALRTLFSQIPGAQTRGWGPGRFSYNSPDGGRCTICEGRGAKLVEMHFLPDVWVVCDACSGKRYDPETLEVRWQGRSIADVLAMRADEALALFTHHRTIHRQLQALVDVGLGYLTLGQPATTLSGGEAQRVKLAAELGSRRGHAVYVLDEPTTGLHLADVATLIAVLHRLVESGHTMITIEHHLGMVSQADWVIDLGPEGGGAGGLVVGVGTPDQIAAMPTATGLALVRDRARALGSAPGR
ncbi:MAG: excinuclease ABC subunit UvrA [Myxococcota bacterium]